MKPFSSNNEIPKEIKLLILLLLATIIIFLNLLKTPFFILAGVVFFKGYTATAIISVLTALLLISIYLVLQKDKLAYLANYMCIALGINTAISLISYYILQNEVIFNVKQYYLESFSAFLSIEQIATLFIITQLIMILIYGSIAYIFVRKKYYLVK